MPNQAKPTARPKRFLRWLQASVASVGVVSAGGVGLPSALHGTTGAVEVTGPDTPTDAVEGERTVMTLNLAHGRGDGLSQMLQTRSRISRKLEEIAAVVRREQIDILAVQEADKPSWWSGNTDHVRAIADASELPWSAHATNVKGLGLGYGTAVAARSPIQAAHGHTFAPTLPTFPKGFAIAAVSWPGVRTNTVDVVSVHLDFASSSARRAQLQELAAVLSKRDRPALIMGDFNTSITHKDGHLRGFVARLNLQSFDPEERVPVTFPARKSRIDWIFVSSDLRLAGVRVLQDVLSDHRAVVATVSPAE